MIGLGAFQLVIGHQLARNLNDAEVVGLISCCDLRLLASCGSACTSRRAAEWDYLLLQLCACNVKTGSNIAQNFLKPRLPMSASLGHAQQQPLEDDVITPLEDFLHTNTGLNGGDDHDEWRKFNILSLGQSSERVWVGLAFNS